MRRIARLGALCLIVVSALGTLDAAAMAVDRIDVRRTGARYVVEFEAQLEAPASEVGAVLTDYGRYPDLDPRILESRFDVNKRQLHTKLLGCLGRMLCRSMKRVEEIVAGPGSLTATALPLESDVAYGVTRSRWRVRDGGTQVTYRLEIEPDFWVPPVIGPRLMLKTLREGTLSLFRNVEAAARARAAEKWGQSPLSEPGKGGQSHLPEGAELP